MIKKHLLDFFGGTMVPLFLSDLMAVRIESDQTYLIIKSAYGCTNKANKIPSPSAILDEETFKTLLVQSTRPMILSDKYVDLNSTERFATMIALYGISYGESNICFEKGFKYIRIKKEYRDEYERIPNLVGKTHLPMRVIDEIGNTVKVEYGCEQILNGTYEIIDTELPSEQLETLKKYSE